MKFGWYANRYFSKIKGRKTCFNWPTLITAQPRIFERLQVVLEFMEKEACLGVVAECEAALSVLQNSRFKILRATFAGKSAGCLRAPPLGWAAPGS